MHLQVALYLLAILHLVQSSILRNHIPFLGQKDTKLGLQQQQQLQQAEKESQIQGVEAPILPKYITKTTIVTKAIQRGTTNGLVTTTIHRKIHVEVNEQPTDNIHELDKRMIPLSLPTISNPLFLTATDNSASPSVSIVTISVTYDFYLGYNSMSSYYTLQTNPIEAPTFTLTNGLLSQFDPRYPADTISGYMGDPNNGFFGIPTDIAIESGVAALGAYPLDDPNDDNYYETSMMTDGIQTGGGSSLTWRNGDFGIQGNQVVWCTVDGNNILLAQVGADPSFSCTPVNVYLAASPTASPPMVTTITQTFTDLTSTTSLLTETLTFVTTTMTSTMTSDGMTEEATMTFIGWE